MDNIVDEAPDRRRQAHHGLAVRSVPVTGLFVLACVYTIALARPFLLPLTLALLLYFLLAPATRGLVRVGLSAPLAALASVSTLLAVLFVSAYVVAWPASDWLARAPEAVQRVEHHLEALTRPLEKLSRTAERVEDLATPRDGATKPSFVQLRDRNLSAVLFGGMQAVAGDALVVVTLVIFLLASGDLFTQKLVRALRRQDDRARAKDIASEIEKQVSEYLYTTTVVNVLFGIAIAVVLALMGMPSALLWGALAFVTSFVPYVGGVVCMAVLGLAAVLTWEDWRRVVAVPAVFLVLETIKGYGVLPVVTGRRLMLNTPVLFIGLLFWWWVWGIAGALLAVPLMSILRIFCERIDGLHPVAEFLGDRETEDEDATPAM